MLISCPHQQLLHARMLRFTHSRVPLQGFLCQIQFLEFSPLCYEQQKRFNIHRHSPSALSVLWYKPGIRKPGETQVNNGERPEISTTRLFLTYDQIMTFAWMWTVTWLFKRETVCGGWDHKKCHVIRWGALYFLFAFWCSFIFGAGILLLCYLYLSSTNWMNKIDIALR